MTFGLNQERPLSEVGKTTNRKPIFTGDCFSSFLMQFSPFFGIAGKMHFHRTPRAKPQREKGKPLLSTALSPRNDSRKQLETEPQPTQPVHSTPLHSNPIPPRPIQFGAAAGDTKVKSECTFPRLQLIGKLIYAPPLSFWSRHFIFPAANSNFDIISSLCASVACFLAFFPTNFT